MRHLLAWLSHTGPELLAPVNILAQTTEERFLVDPILVINKIIEKAHKNKDRKLQLQKLNMKTNQLFIYTNASYATDKDSSSQLG